MKWTRTLYINLQRLAYRSEEAGVVLRLMMVCNDLTFANARFGEVREGVGQDALAEHVRWGAKMYFVRLQIGHMNEAIPIIEEIRKNDLLAQTVSQCSSHAQEIFAFLIGCLQGGANYAQFKSAVMLVRHKTVFHYDDKLVRTALGEMAGRTKRIQSITTSNDVRAVRFSVADEVLDNLTCRFIWKAQEPSLDEVIGQKLDFAERTCRALLEFGGEFIMRYVADNATR
jgi:hypothetical protein